MSTDYNETFASYGMQEYGLTPTAPSICYEKRIQSLWNDAHTELALRHLGAINIENLRKVGLEKEAELIKLAWDEMRKIQPTPARAENQTTKP